MKSTVATTIAGCFALAAFAVAVVSGLASENLASSVLLRAILSMIACYPVGFAIGMIAQHVVVEHVEAHRRAHPAMDGGGDDAAAAHPGADPIEGEEVIVV